MGTGLGHWLLLKEFQDEATINAAGQPKRKRRKMAASSSTAEETTAALPAVQPEQDQIKVEIITDPQDFTPAFHVVADAFGHQAKDAIWTCMTPGWDTVEGQKDGAKKLAGQFAEKKKTTKLGQPNVLFLKGTAPDPAKTDGSRVVVGFAIWQQLSSLEAWGDQPVKGKERLAKALDVEKMYPDDEPTRRWLVQAFGSMYKRRNEVLEEKLAEYQKRKESNAAAATATTTTTTTCKDENASDEKDENANDEKKEEKSDRTEDEDDEETKRHPPAVFYLAMCAVDPSFQRRGIAGKMVQFGMDEAARRGVECVTEASSMGRGAYLKLGFRAEGDGSDIAYEFDEDIKERKGPPNVFLRTGKPE